ncbi:hypothetical protein BCU22_019140 [Vibrio cyclitrophicus]|uniref:hypothetical protein n=1 Tax=Vibrio cyclitrophicus TaxID=47951 RepID=UPI000C84B64A|nr:hypothetical protein [Vibrio cyclitrophicus]PMJ49024.1 hypothetical protein BCU22_03595 [Vibrio cyclitrophicus]
MVTPKYRNMPKATELQDQILDLLDEVLVVCYQDAFEINAEMIKHYEQSWDILTNQLFPLDETQREWRQDRMFRSLDLEGGSKLGVENTMRLFRSRIDHASFRSWQQALSTIGSVVHQFTQISRYETMQLLLLLRKIPEFPIALYSLLNHLGYMHDGKFKKDSVVRELNLDWHALKRVENGFEVWREYAEHSPDFEEKENTVTLTFSKDAQWSDDYVQNILHIMLPSKIKGQGQSRYTSLETVRSRFSSNPYLAYSKYSGMVYHRCLVSHKGSSIGILAVYYIQHLINEAKAQDKKITIKECIAQTQQILFEFGFIIAESSIRSARERLLRRLPEVKSKILEIYPLEKRNVPIIKGHIYPQKGDM